MDMKIALIGYGKMGKEIEKVIEDDRRQTTDGRKTNEIVLKITDDNTADLTVENLKKCDVAIEFTQPEAAVENIYKCFEAGIPVVVGTTAWLERLEEVKQKCAEKNGTLFFSPNYSIGVNIFWEVNRRLAQLMNTQPQYEVSMEEIHHTEKKDAPSGTAVKTAEVMLQELKSKKGWSLQTTDNGQQTTEIPIIAKREPNVPGTHTVTYTSSVDYLEIKHEAKSRRGFAEGAVMAARFVVGKKGVFEMKDLLAI
jgi:4-hydroxy-tetrahydrodipicolinate reductase